jgi:8-oxo-dGTP pyrophosphatase MutT (NUDIX family)
VKTESRIQFGALCFRRSKTKKAGHEILLVSSRDTGPLDHPQGLADGPRNARRRSAMEAWEEAGVRGRVYETCVGHYSYHKWIDEELSLPVVVAVFPIEVLRLDDDFPEAGQRKRKWLSPKKAARRVSEPELRHLLSASTPRACGSDGA